MRNDPHRRAALLDNRGDRLVDQQLRGRVERRRRFIQQQHARFAHECTRNRNALALPTAQLAGADVRVEALRQRLDKLGAVRRARRALHLRTCSIRCAVADILRYRAFEKHGLLRHKRHDGAQRLGRERANVPAVDRDDTCVRFVEAHHQRVHGRLARAGGAHERDARARLDVQVDAT